MVIPCFNAERWIERVLQSCIDQGPLLGEIVVVDDQSADGSVGVVRSFANKNATVVRLFTNPEKGGNNARNFGFAQTRCEFIQWLDADDFLLPGKFTGQVGYLLENPDVDIVVSDWAEHFHGVNDEVLERKVHRQSPKEGLLLDLLSERWSVPANYLMRRELAEKLALRNAWHPSRQVCQDREYFTLAALLSRGCGYVPGLFSIYNRQADGSVSCMDFKKRVALQMELEARLRAEILAQSLGKAQQSEYLNRLNSHVINAFFYNPRVQPRFFFWPWQVKAELIHYKKRLIFPGLYIGTVLNHFVWRITRRRAHLSA